MMYFKGQLKIYIYIWGWMEIENKYLLNIKGRVVASMFW